MAELMLTDESLSPAQLAGVFEESHASLCRQFAALPGGVLDESAQGGRHLAFPDHFMFKGAWKTRLSADIADSAIKETVAWFAAHQAPYFCWWTYAGTTPDDLGHRLVSHGFSPWDTRDGLNPDVPSIAQGAPVMAADLRQLDGSVMAKVPSDFKVTQAVTDAELDAFQQVIAAVYVRHPEVGMAWVDAVRAAGGGEAPWKLYVGWLGDEPVATNVVTSGGGIVGVWNIGTLPAHRGKGIGAAITVAPLLDARAQGYRYAGLFASPLGAPVYERIGFINTGTRLNRYIWRNG